MIMKYITAYLQKYKKMFSCKVPNESKMKVPVTVKMQLYLITNQVITTVKTFK